MPGKDDDDHANGREERFQWLKADPGQFGGLEADQPCPGDYRQLARMPVAAPLPPSRQKEPATDQAGQQYTRDPPVAERRTSQRGRIRPQQRPIRRGRQQHTASQPSGSSNQLQGDQGSLGRAGRPSRRPLDPPTGTASPPRLVTHAHDAAWH